MKHKYIILRASGPSVRAGELLGSSPASRTLSSPSTRMSIDVDQLDTQGVARISRHRDVAVIAPSMPMTLIKPAASRDVAAASGVQWGVRAVGADTSPFSGDGVVVAVLDTGIDPTHPAFTGVSLLQKNFTEDVGGNDEHGHGTHCAGTIIGRDVGGTRIGVARGVRKALIGKVLGKTGGGASDQIVSAIQWAMENGANVISMSLGMDFPGFQKQLVDLGFPAELATSRALEGYRKNVQLFDRLSGLVKSLSNMGSASILIAAAGNESKRDVSPDFKIAVSPPAVSEGLISVAALGLSADKFEVAPFSNTGAIVAGPGVNIVSARAGGGLISMDGTSMATPHVAGVATLWAEKLRNSGQLTAGLLTSRLIASGSTNQLASDFDPTDVGSGMVAAPGA